MRLGDETRGDGRSPLTVSQVLGEAPTCYVIRHLAADHELGPPAGPFCPAIGELPEDDEEAEEPEEAGTCSSAGRPITLLDLLRRR